MSAKSSSSVEVLVKEEAQVPHNHLLIVATVASFLTWTLNVFLNTVSTVAPGLIFQNTVGNQSDKYDLAITPMGWAFSIWGLIFIWNFLWFGYGFAALCRKGASGYYLYDSPGPISGWTYLSFCVVSALTFSWLFVFDRDYIWAALVVLCLTAFSLYVTMFFSLKRLADATPLLRKIGLYHDVGLVHGLHLNGLGVYATWCTVASLLNLAMVLVYYYDVAMETACFVSLGILTLEIVIWVPVDLILLDKWTRYLLTPHLVLVWALSASFLRNYDMENPLKQHTLALLVAAVVATLVKIAFMIYRGCRSMSKEIQPV